MSSTDYRQKCLSNKENECVVCGEENNLKVHHIDGDRDNNSLDNLTVLCGSCHSKLHNSKDPGGKLGELHDELPESTMSWGGDPSKRSGASARIPVTSETKDLADERKPDGWTYDYFLRYLMGDVDAPEGERKMNDTIEFEEGAVREYLDSCTQFWRESDERYAEYYVDAYQSVRESIFGEVKS